MDLEGLRKTIQSGSEAQLNDSIARGALKLSDDKIATVSFVFWLVYMAESDLNDVLKVSWAKASAQFRPVVNETAEKMVLEKIGGTRQINVCDPEYFVDKIKIHEALMGKTGRTRMLWKLNDLRNHLSHNRIEELCYEGQSLSLRKVKEKILMDYFETILGGPFKVSSASTPMPTAPSST